MGLYEDRISVLSGNKFKNDELDLLFDFDDVSTEEQTELEFSDLKNLYKF